jgi:hypothetical protein
MIRDIASNIARSLVSASWRYNGVDAHVPWVFDTAGDRPEYEAALIEAIEAAVTDGDSVALVGAGHGVSSVKASRAAGMTGDVTAFEASNQMASCASATIRNNRTPAPVEVERAVVGPAVEVRHRPVNSQLAPPDLPPAEVLISDCEGAEKEIVPEYLTAHDPRAVVVEIHEGVSLDASLHSYRVETRLNGPGETVVEHWRYDED